MASLVNSDTTQCAIGIKISTLVVKISSRCNIHCDYCYMYRHADQSHKHQPRVLSDTHTFALARQIEDYIKHSTVDCMKICLHGGEPLLAGYAKIEHFLHTMKSLLQDKVLFSIQTNAILLSKKFLDLFRHYHVGVSLSLDGPQPMNDKHRLGHSGESTYEKVLEALDLLTSEYRDLFCGIISVIDPTNNPEEVIDFFAAIHPPSYDLLFPDATHYVPPPGRESNPMLYVNWICRALRYWYRCHPTLRLRTFLDLCEGVLGNEPGSEFFGHGSVSYLVIETDGSYQYSDLLKATYEGAAHTGMFVDTHTIMEVIQGAAIQKFHSFLQKNKCPSCLQCSEYPICGSGQISHRYGPQGFIHPTIYCEEMFAMSRQAKSLIFTDSIQKICNDPSRHTTEVAKTLIHEHSIYLIAKLLEKDLPLDSTSIPHYPLFQSLSEDILIPNEYCVVEGDATKRKEQMSLIVKALEVIQGALPTVSSEILFFCHHGLYKSHAKKEERICVSITHQGTIYLYFFLSEDLSLMRCVRHYLSEYLKQKLLLVSQRFSLFTTHTEEKFQAFLSVYIDAHLFRIFQYATTRDLQLEEELIPFLVSLIHETRALKCTDLSDVSIKILSEIVNEFIPSEGSV